MPKTKSKKRGKYRNVGDYITPDGQKIEGLKRRPDGRFYSAASPTKTFGKDATKAVIKFRQWQSQQNRETVTVEDWSNHPSGKKEPYEKDNMTVIPIPWRHRIPDAEFWSAVADAIAEDPMKAAQKLGLPRDHFLNVKSPGHSLVLAYKDGDDSDRNKKTVGGLYFHRREKMTWQSLRDAKQHWKEFTDCIEARTVNEITREDIRKFSDYVYDRYETETRSTSFVKRRFDLVKTVFRNALKSGEDTTSIQHALGLCAMLVPPKRKKNGKPHPISREHFIAILDATNNPKFKAMWLCMLNFCMKPTEVIVLHRSDIDLKKGVLISDRQKTGETRIGVAWDRTRDAIRDYLKAEPHKAETLFATEEGETYSEIRGGRTISERFRYIRDKAGIPDTVWTEHIRDGAYSAAIEGGADLTHAKLLAGHSIGISDDYVRRNPKMVSDACQAIETYYFSGETTSGKKKD